jgi:hypothetical protein
MSLVRSTVAEFMLGGNRSSSSMSIETWWSLLHAQWSFGKSARSNIERTKV